MKIHYFGTELNSKGHYFYGIDAHSIWKSGIRFDNLPFNPEALPYKATLNKGERKDYHVFGFTILAISGSITDNRPGCKSIFFVEEEITFAQMEQLVRSTKFGSTVIDNLLPNQSTASE